ncbi:MAG: hypothetical protein RR549_02165 [Oscillospiraceae bacterium]
MNREVLFINKHAYLIESHHQFDSNVDNIIELIYNHVKSKTIE